MQRDGATLNMVLHIFLRVIDQSLQAHSPGAAQVDKAALHIGAVAFIHRFGSSLNEHVHFHVCVVDGVFEALAGGTDAGADSDTQAVADAQSSPSKVIFHPVSAIDETAVAQVQATLRRRILRAFVGRGLLESFEAKEMLGYRHSGFSVDTSVRIAALVPPPRTHRHRYYGALAPNSPLRAAVTALAQAAPSQPVKVPAEPATAGCDVLTQSEPAPFRRSAAHYLWAVLIARIYEVFPPLCSLCGGQMRIQ